MTFRVVFCAFILQKAKAVTQKDGVTLETYDNATDCTDNGEAAAPSSGHGEA